MMMQCDGHFFEDFSIGQCFAHKPARTITAGDVSLHIALTGNRFPLYCDAGFAASLGHKAIPVEESLLFNIVFGQSVADISYNAVANLGYAQCRFLRACYPGDTISSTSQVIGLREVSSGEAGIVYVRTEAQNQSGEPVLRFVRWVLVSKRDKAALAPPALVPQLDEVALLDLNTDIQSGKQIGRSGLVAGQWIDHVAGNTVEEAEHQLATRLYQNPAKLHFDQKLQQHTAFGRRLVYGGYVIALARAASFNGLGELCQIVAIHGGQHTAPVYGGDTLYFASEVVSVTPLASGAEYCRFKFFAFKNKRIVTKNELSTAEKVMELEYSAVCAHVV
jgi:2-methylfumaryl-CoA hydratase